MEQETIKSFIQQIELFNGLNDEELQVIASNIEERTYQKGELVFEENTPRARLFIIYQGRVELFKKSCNANYGLGCYNVGLMYEYGEGVRQKFSTAREYFGYACDLKVEDGCEAYAK